MILTSRCRSLKAGEELGVFMKKKSRLSVCPVRTYCGSVSKTRKWFKHFVRGTLETENSLNTHITTLVDRALKISQIRNMLASTPNF
jgi:hypothetical protein